MSSRETDVATARKPGFPVTELDLSVLVGHQVKVFSAQFPGKELPTRAVSCSGRAIEVDRSGGRGMIGNMVTNQQVIVQFPYRSQEVSVRAQFRRTDGGRCLLTLDEWVTPLTQRRFLRVERACAVKLATFPKAVSRFKALSDLRWMATETRNVSSGGVLVNLPGYLQRDVLVLIHLEIPDLQLPPLLLARVRHCYQCDDGTYRAGVEFLVREICKDLLPRPQRAMLPLSVFGYTATMREELNKVIRSRQEAAKTTTSGEPS